MVSSGQRNGFNCVSRRADLGKCAIKLLLLWGTIALVGGIAHRPAMRCCDGCDPPISPDNRLRVKQGRDQCLGDCLSLHKSGGSRSGNCFKRWRGQGFPYAGCTAQGRLAQVSRPRRTNVWLTATSPAPAQSLLTTSLYPGHAPTPVVQIGAASAPINSRRKAQARPPPNNSTSYDDMTHGATK